MDFDLNVDMTSLGTEDQEQLNHTGLVYNLGSTDFIKMLATVRLGFIFRFDRLFSGFNILSHVLHFKGS